MLSERAEHLYQAWQNLELAKDEARTAYDEAYKAAAEAEDAYYEAVYGKCRHCHGKRPIEGGK